jgi:carbon monoxide dehydrogenase subunit G
MLRTVIGTLALIVLLAIGTVLALAATKPDTFRVQRSTSIKAPPEKVFALINDFRSWSAWSPYEHKDPDMKRTFVGNPSGKGAIYEWDGDKNVGSGRITITDTAPPSKVLIDLDMIKPFPAHNLVEFSLEPQGDATNVTWAMRGQVPFPAKVVHVFFDMDRMVGGDFATGLANLKATAERQ